MSDKFEEDINEIFKILNNKSDKKNNKGHI